MGMFLAELSISFIFLCVLIFFLVLLLFFLCVLFFVYFCVFFCCFFIFVLLCFQFFFSPVIFLCFFFVCVCFRVKRPAFTSGRCKFLSDLFLEIWLCLFRETNSCNLSGGIAFRRPQSKG